MSRDKFSSKLVYKNAIYPFAGKNCFFYYYYFNCNGKVGRSNVFLIKFLPILSLQLKKKCDSYIKGTHAIFIDRIIFSKCQKKTHREYTTKSEVALVYSSSLFVHDRESILKPLSYHTAT
jgi:hypothetical protein